MISVAVAMWLQTSAACPATHPFGPSRPATRGIELLENRIHIDPTGARWWNGRRVADNRTLDSYLATTAQLNPQPVTILTFAHAAPCDAITRVRALMDRRLACSKTNACAIGRAPKRRD